MLERIAIVAYELVGVVVIYKIVSVVGEDIT